METEDTTTKETNMKYETLEERNQYYTMPGIAEKIAFYCRWKEICILKHLPDKKMMLRPIKIITGSHFLYWYDRLHLDEISFDLYHSNASIRMPKLPSDLKKLKEARRQLNIEWEKFRQGKNNNFVTSNDFFCDVDVSKAEQRPQALKYAKTVFDELKKQSIGKPEIWDTGGGYHVIIRGIFDPLFCKNLLIEICNSNSLPFASNGDLKPNIDDKVTGDIRRIRRCEFGLHSKTGKPMKRVQ